MGSHACWRTTLQAPSVWARHRGLESNRENGVQFSRVLLRDSPSNNTQNLPGEENPTSQAEQNMTMLIFKKET